MKDILDVVKSWTDETGAVCAKVIMQVSEASDLPEIGEVVGGMKVQPGSFAQIVQLAAWVTLDENDTWYPEQS